MFWRRCKLLHGCEWYWYTDTRWFLLWLHGIFSLGCQYVVSPDTRAGSYELLATRIYWSDPVNPLTRTSWEQDKSSWPVHPCRYSHPRLYCWYFYCFFHKVIIYYYCVVDTLHVVCWRCHSTFSLLLPVSHASQGVLMHHCWLALLQERNVCRIRV